MATSENELPDDHRTANDSAISAPNSRTADRDIEVVLQGLRLTEDIANGPTNEPTTEDQTHTDMSPNVFQVLPPELMAEIFATVCHADSDKFLSDKQRHKRTTPLILSHVCTAWRTLIHSTPHIWSHVCLCLSRDRLSSQIDLLLDWLIRSGACPLNISLCFENEDDWEGEETVPRELVNLLGSAASRWRSLNVVLPERWYSFFSPYLEPSAARGRLRPRPYTQEALHPFSPRPTSL
ncbi:hypothetical protein NLJ89_g4935 [Agrocybe chaxingu]|uniref:F-box domain-containing protein n=1 Tax=Agrocybe chaxingu TaxID=84603 RepID=A0A9W8K1M7_9AGAR|nr:hypothetical protein NLJ89_g4935 [Agrocybe chaxingu]